MDLIIEPGAAPAGLLRSVPARHEWMWLIGKVPGAGLQEALLERPPGIDKLHATNGIH
jgi:hypothetical protein